MAPPPPPLDPLYFGRLSPTGSLFWRRLRWPGDSQRASGRFARTKRRLSSVTILLRWPGGSQRESGAIRANPFAAKPIFSFHEGTRRLNSCLTVRLRQRCTSLKIWQRSNAVPIVHTKLRKQPIFITCERFVRITSNLRFTIFSPPKRDSHKGGSVWGPRNDSRESGDSRESANRFARIGPSKGEGQPGVFPLFWERSRLCQWGSPKPIHLKPGHLKVAFFSARCHLDGAFFV